MNRARSVVPVEGERAARAPSSRCFISLALWNRSLGSIARARATMSSTSRGIDGSTCRGVRVRPWRTDSSTEISLSPVNRRSPVTISKSTTPREKRSERASTGRPQACSGDMYWSFPLSAPHLRLAGLGDGLGDAEVEELDVPLGGDEDVLRRDVAVDEAHLAVLEVPLAMGVVERAGHPRGDQQARGRAAVAAALRAGRG